MDLQGVLQVFANLIETATPLVVALALLFFFWGLATYILAAGSEEKKGKGKMIMVWGVLALFVMVSVWGIVNVLRDTFQLDDNSVEVPRVEVR